MKSGIYLIHCTKNKRNYIGSAIDIHHRWSTHRQQLNQNIHHCIHLQRAWNKYKFENFLFIKLEEIYPENLIKREQQWLDSFELKFKFNVCRTAGSSLGITFKFKKPRSKEHCKKISLAAKQRLSDPKNHPMFGKTHTEETKEKNRKWHLGKKLSNQTKTLIGAAHIGTKKTEETKKQMSKSHFVCNWKITFPNGVYKIVSSLSQFCKQYKLSTGNFVNHGHTKGFRAEKITPK